MVAACQEADTKKDGTARQVVPGCWLGSEETKEREQPMLARLLLHML